MKTSYLSGLKNPYFIVSMRIPESRGNRWSGARPNSATANDSASDRSATQPVDGRFRVLPSKPILVSEPDCRGLYPDGPRFGSKFVLLCVKDCRLWTTNLRSNPRLRDGMKAFLADSLRNLSAGLRPFQKKSGYSLQ